MIALYAAEERKAEVVEAARDWAAAGIVTAAQCAAVEAAYRPALARVSPFFRLLLAAFAFTASVSAVALAGMILRPDGLGGGLLFLTSSAGAALLADRWLVAGRRFYRCGAEEALLAAAVAGAAGGACFLAEAAGASWTAIAPLATGVVALGAAAVALRYGNPLFALAATQALASLPFAFESAPVSVSRALLAVVTAVLAAGSHRLLIRGRRGEIDLLPGYRQCLETVRWLGLAILYVDANSYVDRVAALGALVPPEAAASPLWRAWLCGLATAALPLAGLVLGIRGRDRGLLWFGGLSAIASLLTLKYFFHLGYLPQELTAAGGALAAGGWLLLRWLRSGPNRERGGFTAERILDPRLYGFDLEALAAVQPLAPGPVSGAGGGFRGGGGGFGGGGASGGTS